MQDGINYANMIKTKVNDLVMDSKARADMLSSLKLIAVGRGIAGVTYSINWDIEDSTLLLYVYKIFDPNYNKPNEVYGIQIKDGGLPFMLDSTYDAISNNHSSRTIIANCDNGIGPWSEVTIINNGVSILLEFSSSLMETVRCPMMLYNNNRIIYDINMDKEYVASAARDYVRVLESVIAEYLIITP